MNKGKVGTDQLAALGLTAIVASITVGFLAIGCSQPKSESVATETTATQSTDAGKAPVAANAAASATGKEANATSGEAAADELPPDILATTSADYVAPGEIVEIRAQGTPDVVEVILKDGRGKTQTLEYDPAAALWKGRYRVPLRPAADRIGLSVTGKNGLNLQHRVWVFLQVENTEGEKQVEKVEGEKQTEKIDGKAAATDSL